MGGGFRDVLRDGHLDGGGDGFSFCLARCQQLLQLFGALIVEGAIVLQNIAQELRSNSLLIREKAIE